MRLHSLEITAFGPFASAQKVDFEALSADGLFLLNGPTGAGKSTVLDAVCFALFGQVPGHRRESTRLRSDHAAPGVAPLVVLDFSAAGQRYRVSRSPKWDRPKKRGTGFTSQGAKVRLEKHTEGQWCPVSTRADEVGQQLRAVLGLTLEQFTRVILLPQGQFAEFLHAKHDDRQALLERLFDTSDYAAATEWLAERRKEGAEQVKSAQEERERIVQRAADSFQRGHDALIASGIDVSADMVAHRDESDCLGAASDGHTESGAPVRDVRGSDDNRAGLAEAVEPGTSERASAESDTGQSKTPSGGTTQTATTDIDVDQVAGEHGSVQAGNDQAPAAAPQSTEQLLVLSSAIKTIPREATLDVIRAWRDVLSSHSETLANRVEESRERSDNALNQVRQSQTQISVWEEKLRLRSALSAHLGRRDRVESAKETLTLARRAAECAPPVHRADTTGKAYAAATQAWLLSATDAKSVLSHPETAQACDAASCELPNPEQDFAGSVVPVAQALHDHIQRLSQHLDLDREATAAATSLKSAQAEVQTLQNTNDTLEHTSEKLSRTFTAVTDQVTTLADQSAGEGEVIGELDQAKTLADQLAHHAGLARQKKQLHASLESATERVSAATQSLIQIRTIRTANMAYELAQHLEVDEPCPVCGSATHPAPATPADDGQPPSKSTEDAAAAAVDEARRAQQQSQSAYDQVVGQHQVAAAGVAGHDADTVAATVAALTNKLTHIRATQKQYVAAQAELADTETQLASIRAQQHETSVALSAAKERLTTAEEAVTQATAKLATWKGAYRSVAERLGECSRHYESLNELALCAQQVEQTRAAAKVAEAEADAACREAGFSSVDQARQAFIDVPAREQLEQSVNHYLQQDHHLRQELSRLNLTEDVTDQDLQQSLAHENEQLAKAQGETRDTSRERDRLTGLKDQMQTSIGELTEQVRRFKAQARREGSTIDQAAALDSLSRCVEGRSDDNALKLSLTTFVLAAQLEAVVAAATVRLETMSGGRYALKHTTQRVANTKAGLGIEVEDGWTGQRRATGSLSGGESFMAALSLALGLADVVLSEAGGTRLETLFVDEGFGSLDTATLDDVLNCLDELRSGGRVVGLVSHVPELKERVQAQLTVSKARAGSQISLTGLNPVP